MPKRGRRRTKNRTHVTETNEGATSALQDKLDKVPRSLVVRRGKTAHEVAELVQDLRQMMLPYTALHFQEDPKNRKMTLQKYAKTLAQPMGITHLLAFSQNEDRLNLRIGRTPSGPTLHFRVHQFSLRTHIQRLQRRPVSLTSALTSNPPIVVTNNFGDESHQKLLRITFQNLFPATNVRTVQLNDCRRVVLFNLVKDDDENRQMVQVRHYAIQSQPTGVHRRVRRLVQAKVPNLRRLTDMAEYLQGQSDAASDSEVEDEDQVVELCDEYKGQKAHQKSALKLVELGPRLSMELLKVEQGLGSGGVLYHAHIRKSKEEAAALEKAKEKERLLKIQRRQTQEANVQRKREAAEAKKEAKKRRKEEREQGGVDHEEADEESVEDDESVEDESDS